MLMYVHVFMLPNGFYKMKVLQNGLKELATDVKKDVTMV